MCLRRGRQVLWGMGMGVVKPRPSHRVPQFGLLKRLPTLSSSSPRQKSTKAAGQRPDQPLGETELNYGVWNVMTRPAPDFFTLVIRLDRGPATR